MSRIALSCLLSVLLMPTLSAQDPPKPVTPPVTKEAPVTQEPDAKPDTPKQPPRLELGRPLPVPFTLEDIDGVQHSSQDFADKIVVVDFWSTTCPISRGWEERMAAIRRDYAQRGVVFLFVNSNEGNGEIADREPKREGDKPYQSIRDYLTEHELPYTVLVDHGSRIADLFQARATPHVFVFAPKGALVYQGAIDDDSSGRKGEKATQYLRPVLDKLLTGETVEPSSTPAVGCNVKRPAPAGGSRRGRRG